MMAELRRFQLPVLILAAVLLTGTLGYAILAPPGTPVFDCFYMAVITITTIGYSEVIDLSGNMPGRVFTVFIALSGFGTLTYILSNITAFIVEGQLSEKFWRRKMEKKAKQMNDHYIVCGVSGVGAHIVHELRNTGRPLVIVDPDNARIQQRLGDLNDLVVIEGDGTDEDTLAKAGIQRARGLFAATGEDNLDLVITLTARNMNPGLRVVSRCSSLRNEEKLRTAGADAVVSPTFIGGLRMASEMVRPTVVSFLDTMLRDREKGLRVEEMAVPSRFAQQPLAALQLEKVPQVLVLAVRTDADWFYNPPGDHPIGPGNVLVFMARSGDRQRLEKHVSMLK